MYLEKRNATEEKVSHFIHYYKLFYYIYRVTRLDECEQPTHEVSPVSPYFIVYRVTASPRPLTNGCALNTI